MSKYIFCDFDGTLVHSMSGFYACICEVFDHFGAPRPTFRECVIDLGNDFLAFYRRRIRPDLTHEEIDPIFRRGIKKHFRRPPRLLSNARAFLRDITKMGYEVVLITANQPKAVLPQLWRHDIGCFFSRVHAGHEKKARVMLNYLDQQNGGKCFMLGDTMTDFVAAKECQVPFVGIVPRDLVEDGVNGFPISPGDRIKIKLHFQEQGAFATISDLSEVFDRVLVS